MPPGPSPGRPPRRGVRTMPRLPLHLLVVPLAAGIGLGIARFNPEKVDPPTTDTESGVRPELKARLAQNHAIVKYKDYLVREMVAGRMTLAEVADEFLRVNAEEPKILETVLRTCPGASDREKS